MAINCPQKNLLSALVRQFSILCGHLNRILCNSLGILKDLEIKVINWIRIDLKYPKLGSPPFYDLGVTWVQLFNKNFSRQGSFFLLEIMIV